MLVISDTYRAINNTEEQQQWRTFYPEDGAGTREAARGAGVQGAGLRAKCPHGIRCPLQNGPCCCMHIHAHIQLRCCRQHKGHHCFKIHFTNQKGAKRNDEGRPKAPGRGVTLGLLQPSCVSITSSLSQHESSLAAGDGTGKAQGKAGAGGMGPM